MKKFFTIFFMVLGVIFFIILLLLAYLFIFDPFNIKPFIFNDNEVQTKSINSTENNLKTTNSANSSSTETVVSEKTESSSNLSPAQESALKTIGVEPDAVPQSFTAEQLTCFETVLGKERVNAIKAGDTPSVTEFYKAKDCI